MELDAEKHTWYCDECWIEVPVENNNQGTRELRALPCLALPGRAVPSRAAPCRVMKKEEEVRSR